MKNIYTKELGKRLATVRQQQNLSQEYVADRLGVTRSAICKYESGDREIKMTDFFKICDIFQIEPYKLLDEVRKYVYKKWRG